jgi:hypothetical protein
VAHAISRVGGSERPYTIRGRGSTRVLCESVGGSQTITWPRASVVYSTSKHAVFLKACILLSSPADNLGHHNIDRLQKRFVELHPTIASLDTVWEWRVGGIPTDQLFRYGAHKIGATLRSEARCGDVRGGCAERCHQRVMSLRPPRQRAEQIRDSTRGRLAARHQGPTRPKGTFTRRRQSFPGRDRSPSHGAPRQPRRIDMSFGSRR